MYTNDMNKKQIQKIIQYMICVVFLLALVMVSGCGKETVDDGMTYFHHSIADQTEADTQETQQQEVYLITGIDQTEDETAPVRKEWQNGQIVIIRGNNKYTITGIKIQ